MKEMVGGCCVCLDERGYAENPIVYCDGHSCNVAVHQACYGIIMVPRGPWFCRKCESQERAARVRCELCPLKEGALKRTDSGGWCHVVCALYIPEVSFGSITSMEPIILKKVPQDRFNKSCYICEDQGRANKATTGACMQCNYKTGCRQYFHVTCGQNSGFLFEESSNKKKISYCGYCVYHFKKLKKDPNYIKGSSSLKSSLSESDTSSEKFNRKFEDATVSGPHSPLSFTSINSNNIKNYISNNANNNYNNKNLAKENILNNINSALLNQDQPPSLEKSTSLHSSSSDNDHDDNENPLNRIINHPITMCNNIEYITTRKNREHLSINDILETKSSLANSVASDSILLEHKFENDNFKMEKFVDKKHRAKKLIGQKLQDDQLETSKKFESNTDQQLLLNEKNYNFYKNTIISNDDYLKMPTLKPNLERIDFFHLPKSKDQAYKISNTNKHIPKEVTISSTIINSDLITKGDYHKGHINNEDIFNEQNYVDKNFKEKINKGPNIDAKNVNKNHSNEKSNIIFKKEMINRETKLNVGLSDNKVTDQNEKDYKKGKKSFAIPENKIINKDNMNINTNYNGNFIDAENNINHVTDANHNLFKTSIPDNINNFINSAGNGQVITINTNAEDLIRLDEDKYCLTIQIEEEEEIVEEIKQDINFNKDNCLNGGEGYEKKKIDVKRRRGPKRRGRSMAGKKSNPNNKIRRKNLVSSISPLSDNLDNLNNINEDAIYNSINGDVLISNFNGKGKFINLKRDPSISNLESSLVSLDEVQSIEGEEFTDIKTNFNCTYKNNKKVNNIINNKCFKNKLRNYNNLGVKKINNLDIKNNHIYMSKDFEDEDGDLTDIEEIDNSNRLNFNAKNRKKISNINNNFDKNINMETKMILPLARSKKTQLNGHLGPQIFKPRGKYEEESDSSTNYSRNEKNDISSEIKNPLIMEDLLEMQWKMGSEFLMQQGQSMDIADLLNSLYQLKNENRKLENCIEDLTEQKNNLLAINAKLTLNIANPLESNESMNDKILNKNENIVLPTVNSVFQGNNLNSSEYNDKLTTNSQLANSFNWSCNSNETINESMESMENFRANNSIVDPFYQMNKSNIQNRTFLKVSPELINKSNYIKSDRNLSPIYKFINSSIHSPLSITKENQICNKNNLEKFKVEKIHDLNSSDIIKNSRIEINDNFNENILNKHLNIVEYFDKKKYSQNNFSQLKESINSQIYVNNLNLNNDFKNFNYQSNKNEICQLKTSKCDKSKLSELYQTNFHYNRIKNSTNQCDQSRELVQYIKEQNNKRIQFEQNSSEFKKGTYCENVDQIHYETNSGRTSFNKAMSFLKNRLFNFDNNVKNEMNSLETKNNNEQIYKQIASKSHEIYNNEVLDQHSHNSINENHLSDSKNRLQNGSTASDIIYDIIKSELNKSIKKSEHKIPKCNDYIKISPENHLDNSVKNNLSHQNMHSHKQEKHINADIKIHDSNYEQEFNDYNKKENDKSYKKDDTNFNYIKLSNFNVQNLINFNQQVCKDLEDKSLIPPKILASFNRFPNPNSFTSSNFNFSSISQNRFNNIPPNSDIDKSELSAKMNKSFQLDVNLSRNAANIRVDSAPPPHDDKNKMVSCENKKDGEIRVVSAPPTISN